MVAIAHMPFPIPKEDIQETAEYAYYRQTALDETKQHKSHSCFVHWDTQPYK